MECKKKWYENCYYISIYVSIVNHNDNVNGDHDYKGITEKYKGQIELKY